MNLNDLTAALSGLTDAHRPIRLRLTSAKGVRDDALLVQQVSGREDLFGGIEYRLLCVSLQVGLPLEEFTGMPAELQFVTDRGGLRSVCGIVAEAAEGQSDGGLATYRLVVRDALALLEHKTNTRVFRDKDETEISSEIINEWRNSNPVAGRAFELDLSHLAGGYPKRAFTQQRNESDAAFLRRLWKRRGIAWFIRPGQASERGSAETPAHALVLCNDSWSLPQNPAGVLRYHRDAATEERDGVFAWSREHRLRPGVVARHSWDYKEGRPASAESASAVDQGALGNALATSLVDYLSDSPHAGENRDDYDSLAALRMQRHQYEMARHLAESGVRDVCVGQWNALTGHPEIDTHPPEQREFIVTALAVVAQNNLPKDVQGKAHRLFAASGWEVQTDEAAPGGDGRYRNRFTCVRRGVQLVPAFDPRVDLPSAHPAIAVVAGPEGEEVHCDDLGRVKVRFTECRAADHEHAQGAGASGSDRDSAWVRVGTGWAGAGYGINAVPRAGMEALILFVNGDVDKPVIVQLLPGALNTPLSFDGISRLPDEKNLSGWKSKEVHGTRHNQLRFDDTTGQINAQLASEHQHSQLNLGWLTHPRRAGKGEARGEGAELRSDAHLVQRARAGVFISADAQARAGGPMLERSALLGLADVLHSIQQQLSELSGTHYAETTDGAKLAQIVRQLKDWDGGTNVNPQGAGGSAPMVAVSAPAGIGIASGDNLLLGAQTHIDAVSAGNTQLSVGRKLLMRAAEGISLFAHRLGIKLVAAAGKIEIQAHGDNIQITTPRNIVLTAGEAIVLQAPVIRQVAQGAQVDIGNGAITQQSSGGHTIKSSNFAHAGPGGGTPPGVAPLQSSLQTDEKFVLVRRGSGRPAANRRYRIELDDGRSVEGVSDAQGRTQLAQDQAFKIARITILKD